MSRAIRILWPDDMPDERARSVARAMVEIAVEGWGTAWGALLVGVPPDRKVERRRAHCEKCDAAWWVHEVLSYAETQDRDPRPRQLDQEDRGPCPFCDLTTYVAELPASAVRELVAAIVDTPIVHELAVAADLAQQDGRTTHEQTRHPGDAALIETLLRSAALETVNLDGVARERFDELVAYEREQALREHRR